MTGHYHNIQQPSSIIIMYIYYRITVSEQLHLGFTIYSHGKKPLKKCLVKIREEKNNQNLITILLAIKFLLVLMYTVNMY